jgi:hypothetical protein
MGDGPGNGPGDGDGEGDGDGAVGAGAVTGAAVCVTEMRTSLMRTTPLRASLDEFAATSMVRTPSP